MAEMIGHTVDAEHSGACGLCCAPPVTNGLSTSDFGTDLPCSQIAFDNDEPENNCRLPTPEPFSSDSDEQCDEEQDKNISLSTDYDFQPPECPFRPPAYRTSPELPQSYAMSLNPSQLTDLTGYSDSEIDDESDSDQGDGRSKAHRRSSVSSARQLNSLSQSALPGPVEQTNMNGVRVFEYPHSSGNSSRAPPYNSKGVVSVKTGVPRRSQYTGPRSFAPPTQSTFTAERKRPLTPSAPTKADDPKRTRHSGPFDDTSDDESQPTKAPTRRLNLSRLRQAIDRNGSTLVGSLSQEGKPAAESVKKADGGLKKAHQPSSHQSTSFLEHMAKQNGKQASEGLKKPREIFHPHLDSSKQAARRTGEQLAREGISAKSSAVRNPQFKDGEGRKQEHQSQAPKRPAPISQGARIPSQCQTVRKSPNGQEDTDAVMAPGGSSMRLGIPMRLTQQKRPVKEAVSGKTARGNNNAGQQADLIKKPSVPALAPEKREAEDSSHTPSAAATLPKKEAIASKDAPDNINRPPMPAQHRQTTNGLAQKPAATLSAATSTTSKRPHNSTSAAHPVGTSGPSAKKTAINRTKVKSPTATGSVTPAQRHAARTPSRSASTNSNANSTSAGTSSALPRKGSSTKPQVRDRKLKPHQRLTPHDTVAATHSSLEAPRTVAAQQTGTSTAQEAAPTNSTPSIAAITDDRAKGMGKVGPGAKTTTMKNVSSANVAKKAPSPFEALLLEASSTQSRGTNQHLSPQISKPALFRCGTGSFRPKMTPTVARKSPARSSAETSAAPDAAAESNRTNPTSVSDNPGTGLGDPEETPNVNHNASVNGITTGTQAVELTKDAHASVSKAPLEAHTNANTLKIASVSQEKAPPKVTSTKQIPDLKTFEERAEPAKAQPISVTEPTSPPAQPISDEDQDPSTLAKSENAPPSHGAMVASSEQPTATENVPETMRVASPAAPQNSPTPQTSKVIFIEALQHPRAITDFTPTTTVDSNDIPSLQKPISAWKKQVGSVPVSAIADPLQPDRTPKIFKLPTGETVHVYPRVIPEPDTFTQDNVEATEPYFGYTVYKKLLSESDTDKKYYVLPTRPETRVYTDVAQANEQAARMFRAAEKEYPLFFNVQFLEWKSTRDKYDCVLLTGTFAPMDYPSRKSVLTIGVERQYISQEVALYEPPPERTPFISKTLYTLRLFKLVENPTRASAVPDASDSDGSDEVDSADSDVEMEDSDKTKPKRSKKALQKHKNTPPPNSSIRQYQPLPCTEVYTTLSGANQAALKLQIELSHEKDPSSQTALMWQQQNNKELHKKLRSLDPEHGGKEGCWKSEFNACGLGGDRFELVVEKVGLYGPRNL